MQFGFFCQSLIITVSVELQHIMWTEITMVCEESKKLRVWCLDTIYLMPLYPASVCLDPGLSEVQNDRREAVKAVLDFCSSHVAYWTCLRTAWDDFTGPQCSLVHT